MRTDPFMNFKFLVEIDGIERGGFARVKGIAREIKVDTYREGGVNDYEHKFVNQTTCNLTSSAVSSTTTCGNCTMLPSKAISSAVPSPSCCGIRRTRRNGVVDGAIPIKWSGTDLDAASFQILVESITLPIAASEGEIDDGRPDDCCQDMGAAPAAVRSPRLVRNAAADFGRGSAHDHGVRFRSRCSWRRCRSPLQSTCDAARLETPVQGGRTEIARHLRLLSAARRGGAARVLDVARVAALTPMPPGASSPAPSHWIRSFSLVWRNQIVRQRLLTKSSIIARPSPFADRRTNLSRTLRGCLGATDVVIVQKGDTGFAGVSPSPIHGETALRLRGQGSALPRPAPFQVCRKLAECLGAGCGCRQRNKSPAFTTAVRSTVARFARICVPVGLRATAVVPSTLARRKSRWSGASTPDGQAGTQPATGAYQTSGPAAATATAAASSQQAARQNFSVAPASAKQSKLDAAVAIIGFASRLADEL